MARLWLSNGRQRASRLCTVSAFSAAWPRPSPHSLQVDSAPATAAPSLSRLSAWCLKHENGIVVSQWLAVSPPSCGVAGCPMHEDYTTLARTSPDLQKFFYQQTQKLICNKCIGDDTKAATRRSPTCIRKTRNTFCGKWVSVPLLNSAKKTAYSCKISLKSGNRLWSDDYQDGGCLPCWILGAKNGFFWKAHLGHRIGRQ